MTVESRIKDFAESKPKRKAKVKKEWQPPVLDDFLDGAVLAYDQGAFTTGWCYFWKHGSNIQVLDKGVFKEPPVPTLKGHADTLQRATWMGERLMQHIHEPRILPTDPNDYWIVCEMPAVAGWRPELSLMGALVIRLATEKYGALRVRMVQNQHMRSVLVGREKDDRSKRVVKEAVARYTNVTGNGWNEHNRDALSLGLTFLYDEKRRRDEQH